MLRMTPNSCLLTWLTKNGPLRLWTWRSRDEGVRQCVGKDGSADPERFTGLVEGGPGPQQLAAGDWVHVTPGVRQWRGADSDIVLCTWQSLPGRNAVVRAGAAAIGRHGLMSMTTPLLQMTDPGGVARESRRAHTSRTPKTTHKAVSRDQRPVNLAAVS